jgi:hypothetical protein
VQAAFAVQATQVPERQTWLAPQAVPFVRETPRSPQTGAPVPQPIPPAWQTFAGVQAWPATQATHDPAPSHTLSVPQPAPAATFSCWSTQTGSPEPQVTFPVWHGFAGVQAAPSVQALQPPARHTRFVPHELPSVTSRPESTHTSRPVAQEVAPVWQGKAAGVHAFPGWQAPHVPRAQ